MVMLLTMMLIIGMRVVVTYFMIGERLIYIKKIKGLYKNNIQQHKNVLLTPHLLKDPPYY